MTTIIIVIDNLVELVSSYIHIIVLYIVLYAVLINQVPISKY